VSDNGTDLLDRRQDTWMASERGSSRVGTMFGPYEIRSLIGAGGMGEVYQT
jgi:hypothetical protein